MLNLTNSITEHSRLLTGTDIQPALEHICLHARESNFDLIIVGSVAYKRGSESTEYQDLDLIFVINEKAPPAKLPLFTFPFFKIGWQAMQRGFVDLISTKTLYRDTPLSIDVVTPVYLSRLCNLLALDGSMFMRKCTTSLEVPYLVTHGINGTIVNYYKQMNPWGKYKIYKLPVYFRTNGELFPGVLLNKLIDAPLVLYDGANKSSVILEKIGRKWIEVFIRESRSRQKPEYAFRKWNRYSNFVKEEMRDKFCQWAP
jgi:hypothetical protein